MLKSLLVAAAVSGIQLGIGTVACAAQDASTFTAVTSDGVVVHGERYFGTLDSSGPLVLLFHQGDSSGRGEYAALAEWLNDSGFRAIAWDQRSGGELHGERNRTVDGLGSGIAAGFCDAYPDLQAALDLVTAQGLAREVVVWGSSYSGALVFRLAAENPDRVAGVIAFSPASGGPMVDCRARQWLDRLSVPVVVFRPRSEMERESSVEQRALLGAAGVEFHVVDDGVHGSSMLLDERTGHDMQATRRIVLQWLGAVFGGGVGLT